MYERFYGLRERPFELGSHLRFLYLPPGHQEVLSTLQYAISARKGLTVLTGEAGTGKTTLLRAAIARERDGGSACVHISDPRLTRDELFEAFVRRFELSIAPAASKVSCLTALDELLTQRFAAGSHTTLIVDEVQTAPDEVVEELRLLTNLDDGSGERLSVILVGQPEFAARLNEPSLRNLKQRVALRGELRALDFNETAAYMSGRIRIAGGNPADIFSREAVMAIYEASAGVPRTINVVCDNVLIAGFASETRPVNRALVQDVMRDFDLHATAAADPAASAPVGRAEAEAAPRASAAAPTAVAVPATTAPAATAVAAPAPLAAPAAVTPTAAPSASAAVEAPTVAAPSPRATLRQVPTLVKPAAAAPRPVPATPPSPAAPVSAPAPAVAQGQTPRAAAAAEAGRSTMFAVFNRRRRFSFF